MPLSKVRIVGRLVFSGDLKPNPDAAEAELRQAGFTVVRPSAKKQFRIAQLVLVAGDDFSEVLVDVLDDADDPKTIDTVKREIELVANKYGGTCMEYGVESCDYWPDFKDLFRED
jgi:hypothetical protein